MDRFRIYIVRTCSFPAMGQRTENLTGHIIVTVTVKLVLYLVFRRSV